MRKELCEEARAMQLIMRYGKKEALIWATKFMDIVEYVGEYNRVYYWNKVKGHIESFIP